MLLQLLRIDNFVDMLFLTIRHFGSREVVILLLKNVVVFLSLLGPCSDELFSVGGFSTKIKTMVSISTFLD